MSTQLQLLPETNTSIQRPETDRVAALQLWDVVSRNRAFILSGFAIALVAALLFAFLSAPVYESATSIRIDEKEKGLPVLDALAVLSDGGSELSTEMQTLRSRTLAESTVDSLGLQVAPKTRFRLLGIPLPPFKRVLPRDEVFSFVSVARTQGKAHYRLEQEKNYEYSLVDVDSDKKLGVVRAGELVKLPNVQFSLAPAILKHASVDFYFSPFDITVLSLQHHLTVSRPQRDAQIVLVRFQSEDPVLASQVPNTLTQKFLELRNQIQKTEARSTVRFLSEQIDTLSQQLSATEEAVRAFREGNRVVNLSDEAAAQVSEFAKLQAERNQKEAEREALSHALQEAQARSTGAGADSSSAYRSLIAFPTLLTTNAAQFLQALNDAENQRALLLQRRTREDRDVQVLTARIRELQQQLSSIAETYLNGLSSQIASTDAALARFNVQLSRIPSKELQLAKLERQNKVLVEIFTLLQTKLQEAKIAQAVEDSRVRVVDPALIPNKPVKPNKSKSLILGSFFGLILAIGLTITRESIDPSVHMLEDVTVATGLSSLGVVPHMDTFRDNRGPVPINQGKTGAQRQRQLMGGLALFDPKNPALEAYRTLRTNITFARADAATLQILVFTSPTPGDGKTTTTANLASTLSQQGLRVLLVDGDMRRGTIHQVFALSREPGLSNVLVGAMPLAECIRHKQVGELGSLDILPCGAAPPNPSELISSSRMEVFLGEMKASYDIVIFDSPPLNLVTDAAILATKADGVVLVARAGVTTKGALTYAADLLRKVRAPALGFVLNDFLFRRDNRYSAYGGYGEYVYGYYSSEVDQAHRNRIQKLFGTFTRSNNV
jgi:tyrosine-protein kinase Etk/Wzc